MALCKNYGNEAAMMRRRRGWFADVEDWEFVTLHRIDHADIFNSDHSYSNVLPLTPSSRSEAPLCTIHHPGASLQKLYDSWLGTQGYCHLHPRIIQNRLLPSNESAFREHTALMT